MTLTAKLEVGVFTGQVRDGAGVTAPVIRDSQSHYTPGISETRAGVTTYLHSGLKDATAQSSVGQVVTASRVYDAFGMVVSSTGTWKGPFGYSGEHGYQEDATGLQLLGHRYYDPSTGRFLTRDPAKDGRNWYGYCGGAPTSYADPSGLTRIWMALRQVGDLPHFHALIIVEDEETGETYVAEAGPEYLLFQGLLLTGWLKKRRIAKNEHRTTLLVDDDKPVKTWLSKIDKAMQKMRRRRVFYQAYPINDQPDSGNSNSWARELLERIGLSTKNPYPRFPIGYPAPIPGWEKDPWHAQN